MSIRIRKTGILSSLQDCGRIGFRRYGVPVSGSMDQHAAAVANLLAGNHREEAVIEITLHGMQVEFLQDSLVAFTGSGSRPYLGARAIDINKAVWILKGSVIDFRYHESGCRLYMAIAGGWMADKIMNSRSCFPPAGAGKIIAVGDYLYGGRPSHRAVKIVGQMDTSAVSMSGWGYGVQEKATDVVRVMKGHEWEEFTAASHENWMNSRYTVTTSSNRMGYRLSGNALQLKHQKEMISSAVVMGAVQVTPDGNPLILLSDAQTTGGYPRIAQVIDVDFSILAQKRPGDKISFLLVNPDIAESLYILNDEQLSRLEKTIESKTAI
jgi:antagonist of KipI